MFGVQVGFCIASDRGRTRDIARYSYWRRRWKSQNMKIKKQQLGHIPNTIALIETLLEY